MKIALLFAGQGAQYSGMGKDLRDNYSEAERVFDMAGEEIQGWCFEGTKEMLRQTEITQPSIYTVTMAAYYTFMKEFQALRQSQNFSDCKDQVEIAALAGFSLGEYGALVAGGAIKDFKTGLEIVKKRGHWMSESGKGGMVAAMGHREDVLRAVEIARVDGVLEGVNFNSPTQTVVAGDKEALLRFMEVAKDLGGVKTVLLSVGNAFHSPLMNPVEAKLKALLSEAGLNRPSMPIYSNVTTRDITETIGEEDVYEESGREKLVDLMARQVKSPVYWQELIDNLAAAGIDAMVEIGPGNTLSGLVRKTCHGMPVMNVENRESLEKTIGMLKEMSCRE